MIYVDELQDYPLAVVAPAARRYGGRWCHLLTDGPAEELHAFAARIGLRRAWFQAHANPRVVHYDLTPARRLAALRAGAQPTTGAAWAEQIAVVREARARARTAAAEEQRGGEHDGG